MEDANICKYCECVIDDDLSECKNKSFEELVNDSKKTEVDETAEPKVCDLTVIKWIVENVFDRKIQTSDLESIVSKCVSDTYKEDILNTLKLKGVNIKIEGEDIISENPEYAESVICSAFLKSAPEILSWIGREINSNLISKDLVLHYAAEHGQLDLIKWLVLEGCNIHSLDAFNCNALFRASMNNHFDCIKYLVHKNVDINVKGTGSYNVQNISSMYCAATSKNLDIMKFLIAHGGNIHDIHCCEKNTLLHAAANSVEMMQLLVSLGLDINARNFLDQSVLNLASAKENIKVIEWLLEQGLPYNDILSESYEWISNSDLNCPNLEILNLAIKHMSDINTLIGGETLLHKSANAHQGLKAVKLLVENNADVNARSDHDADNVTPLLVALDIAEKEAEDGETGEIIQYLLSKGADVKAKATDGETALLYAVYHQRIDVVKQLIELGADANASTVDGLTVLRQATATEILEIVQLIVEAGANVNQLDEHGISDLNFIAQKSCWDIAKYLIENGADINHECEDICSPIIYEAFQTQNLEIVYWLTDHGALEFLMENGYNILHECLHFQNKHERLEILKLFITRGVNINIVDEIKENTILHSCIDDLPIVDYVLKNGININVQNKNGKTELYACIKKINDDIYCQTKCLVVKKLIKYGANVNIANNKGVTPLHLAVRDPLNVDIVQVLLANGADVHAKDKLGNSVLHYAVDRDMAEMLCERGANIISANYEGISVLENALNNAPVFLKSKYNIVKLVESQKLGLKYTNILSSYEVDAMLKSRRSNYVEYLIEMTEMKANKN